jgi:hypothetical protein
MQATLRAIIVVSACLAESVNSAPDSKSIRGHAPTAGRRVWFAGLVILSLATLVDIPVVRASCRLEEIAEFHVDLVGNPQSSMGRSTDT